jgi:tetratricopeptide (TPR) repeat protein
VQPRPAARQALERAGFVDTSTAADRIIDDHNTCYPPADIRTVFEPLHPDRLGEDLIALSTPGHGHPSITRLERDWTPESITGLLASGPQPPVWGAAAVTVLVEAARRWPHLATSVLYPLLREHPQLAIAAGGSTLSRLTGIPGVDPTVLEALESLLPTGRHIDLDIAAAAITSALTRHRLAHTTDPAEHARLHAIHAVRLANAGRREEALAPAEEAASTYRRLAEANPDAYLPELAMSLNSLGGRLAGLGQREQALARIEEATGIYRRLAEADPAAWLPDFATSLSNVGIRLAELGRQEEGCAHAEEATGIYRRLAEANPAAHLPDLAMSLDNLGVHLAGLGRRHDGVNPAEEATGIYRRLAEANPAVYLPNLAMSLNNLGKLLSDLGRQEQALGHTEGAVSIHRRLAQANPAAFEPDLATSLINLGLQLAALNRREALAPAEEATEMYRRLAKTNPAAYLPDLAVSLRAYARTCTMIDHNLPKALEAADEAVILYQQLATWLPQVFGAAELRLAHQTLADVRVRLGHTDHAVRTRRMPAASNNNADPDGVETE